MTGFVMFALPVAAGIVAIAPLPGSGGSMAEDLLHIRDWKPSLVITLTTLAEETDAGLTNLGARLQDAGARWVHFPVDISGAPALARSETWHQASKIALSALRGGGRVLIHSARGRGRSGMAALRLMVEAGEPPDQALERLRALRPCAVETPAQIAWASHR